MRNVFDQYSQPENRLTHALVSTLSHDRRLIRPFLHWLGVRGVPPTNMLRIVEQQVPRGEVSGDELESKGLPDACIYTDDSWAVLFEAKVQAAISINQLKRHIATAKQHGYESPSLVLLSVERPKKPLPERTKAVEWRQVYAWFCQHAQGSPWGQMFIDYMQVFESKMLAQDYAIRGTITMFNGLRFDEDNPYTCREGKRLIRLLGDRLQKRKDLHAIGIDPTGKRHSSIKGRGIDRVWDFLPIKRARKAKMFTDFPHYTMGLAPDGAVASVTVPNGVRGGFRTKLKELEADGFFALATQLEKAMRPVMKRSKGVKPLIYATQRHFKSMSSGGDRDARLDVDLRTVVRGGRDGVKYQPEWIDAIYTALTNKRSNIQFGVDVNFKYDCPIIRSPKAADLFAETWIALYPLVKFVMDK